MEDEQSQTQPTETPAVETQHAAPPQETPSEPTLAQVVEAAQAKAEAESAKRESQ
jgi:hypothetical protein